MPIIETYKFKFTPWTEGKPREYALILCKDRSQTVGNALCGVHPYRLWRFTDKNGDFKPTLWCDLSEDVKRITQEEVDAATLAEKDKEIAELKKQIALLQAKLSQNPENNNG